MFIFYYFAKLRLKIANSEPADFARVMLTVITNGKSRLQALNDIEHQTHTDSPGRRIRKLLTVIDIEFIARAGCSIWRVF